jgi:hypothetical protein
MKKCSFFVLLLYFSYDLSAAATQAKTRSLAPAAPPSAKRAPASDPDAPIEVKGQSRNLNMMLILQNKEEMIDFIKLRKDYQEETNKLNY